MKLLNGKIVSDIIKDDLKNIVDDMRNNKNIKVCLSVIQVGDDPASSVYVRNKKKACEYIGIDCDLSTTLKATKDIRDKYVLSRFLWDLGIIEEYRL